MVAENGEENSTWKRLDEGRRAKAAKGEYAGYGSPAFGQKSLNGKLVEDSAEQQLIELIRRHHKSGKSLQKIADWLNFHGYKTKRGQQWKKISVKRVLDRLYGRTTRESGVTDISISDPSRSISNESTIPGKAGQFESECS